MQPFRLTVFLQNDAQQSVKYLRQMVPAKLDVMVKTTVQLKDLPAFVQPTEYHIWSNPGAIRQEYMK